MDTVLPPFAPELFRSSACICSGNMVWTQMCTNSGEYPTCMAMAAENQPRVEKNFT
jgi:hypothetical protein